MKSSMYFLYLFSCLGWRFITRSVPTEYYFGFVPSVAAYLYPFLSLYYGIFLYIFGWPLCKDWVGLEVGKHFIWIIIFSSNAVIYKVKFCFVSPHLLFADCALSGARFSHVIKSNKRPSNLCGNGKVKSLWFNNRKCS